MAAERPVIPSTPLGLELTSSHWGVSEVVRPAGGGEEDGRIRLRPWRDDPAPTPIGAAMADAYRSPVRITRPAVRAGWLEHGPGPAAGARGNEPFVEVSWDEAFELVAAELERVIARHGNGSIFGGSYGWSSAGRFHHAQGQVHRFLNVIGGYVRSVDSYSLGAGKVIMPYVVRSLDRLQVEHTSWDVLAANTDLFVSFGGAPAKNSQIGEGGASQHLLPGGLAAMAANGCRFVNISPLRDDIDPGTAAAAEWIPIRPNADTAVMLALTTELVLAGRHDVAFLADYCVGFDTWAEYLLGKIDGVVKDADWAGPIAEVPPERMRSLAHEMADARTMINIAWSLQRADHGEQPFWAGVGLAAVLGQIGLPGGGFGVAYGPAVQLGSAERLLGGPRYPQGTNAVHDFIPVARIADMLTNPAGRYTYRGETRHYPDIRLVYWAGGNPFHHHQDLNRLAQAWQRPDTVIVNEQVWNAHAKMADIVLPVTSSLERNDIGYANLDPLLIAMKQIHEPWGESLDDYAIFAGIAGRMGRGQEFTEGRSAEEWLAHMYGESRSVWERRGVGVPTWEELQDLGSVRFPPPESSPVMLDRFRADPDRHRLTTPSGRIELHCETIAGFDLEDCPGHPAWLEPAEWLGDPLAERFPLHLISDQPHTKLHSQLDHSAYSKANKIHDREPVRLHPDDAEQRGIADGDLVRVFNDRGQCLAGARLSDGVRPGVVALATGAWWDQGRPGDPSSLDRHGNPNVLTRDAPASNLSQGCAAQTCLVQIERSDSDPPPVRAFEPPPFVVRPT